MSGDLGGFSMFELFREELRTHTGPLREALEQLRQDSGNPEALESFLHASHSIKGAARIVDASVVEQVARAMEECAEAAGKGSVRLSPQGVDLLGEGVEFLASFTAKEEDAVISPPSSVVAEAGRLAESLDAIRGGKMVPAPPGASEETPEPAKAAAFAPAASPADLSMMELFQAEVETQAAKLNSGLLDLETDLENQQRIEPVMRAAHSIKGAARIVGLDSLTRLAHALEDVLVAAQEKKLTLTEEHLDVFFRTADIFGRMANMTAEEIAAWPVENAGAVNDLVGVLEVLLRTGAVPKKVQETPPAKTVSPSPLVASGGGDKQSGTVRVSSDSLNRLMELAAESLVNSRRLVPLSAAILAHRRAHVGMSEILDRLRARLIGVPGSAILSDLVQEAEEQNESGLRALARHQEDIDYFVSHAVPLSELLYKEVIASRMRPFGDSADAFRRMVRDVSRSLGKKVQFVVEGRDTPVDRDVLDDLKAPLNHLLRNAIDHGIEMPEERTARGKPETATVTVRARHHAGMLLLEVEDDGRGIDLDELRRKIVAKGLASEELAAGLSEAELLEFPFLPGFSTASRVTEVSGRGVGLDVVQTMVRAAGGSVRLTTEPGKGTIVHLHLPVTRSVIRALVAEIDGEPYAFPLTGVRQCLQVDVSRLLSAEGRQYIVLDGKNVGVVSAREALELGEEKAVHDVLPVIVLGDKDSLYGLAVDSFVGQYDLVIRPLDKRLGKVANISAAALIEDGSPALIVDVDDLIQTIDSLLAGGRIGRLRRLDKEPDEKRRKTVLVVDDSITVRETERKLLENRGYAVDVAVDGVDGWNAVRLGSYDLVISDVDMPRMTGIELVRRIKNDARLSALPVMIVSYKDREEDRMAGLEAGANYYLTKSSFKDEALLSAVADLIGEAEE